MNTRKKTAYLLAPLLGILFIIALAWLVRDVSIPVLNPQGQIADQQRDILFFALGLSAIVVIPVFILTFFIAWRYHEGNKKAKYQPELKGNLKLEAVWWGIPFAIVLVLAVVTWITSHTLDPYKPLESEVKPLKVQVVALEWKWLFIYPEQKVASVNLLNFPEKTPLEFSLTSDAPMNAFSIPSLGSQVYAMSGMSSKLHLIANSTGVYQGRSTNISGEGFADMEFRAESMTETAFLNWVDTIRDTKGHLNQETYKQLAEPGVMEEPKTYVLADNDLYDTIIKKYMPHSGNSHNHDMTSMEGK